MPRPQQHHRIGAATVFDVLCVLADYGQCTRHKIAEEIELRRGRAVDAGSVSRALTLMHRNLLVEKVGRAKKPPTQKSGYGPNIYRLHSRIRYAV